MKNQWIKRKLTVGDTVWVDGELWLVMAHDLAYQIYHCVEWRIIGSSGKHFSAEYLAQHGRRNAS